MSADVPDKPLKLRNLTKSKKSTEPEAKKDEFDDEFGLDNEAPSLSLSYGSIFFCEDSNNNLAILGALYLPYSIFTDSR